ncbi:MAG: response regulator [Agarilytica sp.]
MQATQEVFRVRRQYNKWVANQTLEDYALRFTAKRARRWPISWVAQTALGATAFLALEAIAAALTLNYGFTNTLWAMLSVALVIFITGCPISYYAARYGLDIDLLTRGAGFGYLGSTITSLIYASFTFIFFAIEAAILASALKALLGIPLEIGYIICAVAVIPIVTHGISAISRFQVGTQLIWLVLQLAAIATVLYFEFSRISDWTRYTPRSVENAQTFNFVLFGAAASILFSMVAQIGEQVDYLRFMPEKTDKNKKQWWFWLLLAGPGWILIGLVKMLLGSFLAYLAITSGDSFETASDPTHMYQTVFLHLTNSPTLALSLAAIMVIISQMKINVTNAYAGSIAWSNFFSRVTHSHPGRVVWLVFNVVIALILMELGIYRALESILSVFAIVAVSWLSSLAADLMINKQIGLSPKHIEFKRAHLYDINPVGVGSMVIASTLGILCYLGYFGEEIRYAAHFLSIGLCFVLVPFIAWVTKGKYYIARESEELIQLYPIDHSHNEAHEIPCSICENHFEREDMSYCPAYQGTICSLCCSLDSRCMDNCKPNARLSEQTFRLVSKVLSVKAADFVNSRLGRLITMLLGINLISLSLLSLIYFQMQPTNDYEAELLQQSLTAVFFIFLVISGIICWIFLLTHESRVIAQQESNRQTRRLMREIAAHKKTDRALQEAKELAERANIAKSRYLTGISHELRTPLQSVMGYAQLLTQKEDIPNHHKPSLNIIRRSGDYLKDLIEGLLDISKIEAGKLEIYRNEVKFVDLIEQLNLMFRQQADDKGLTFHSRIHNRLPTTVIADEKRLRQVLINVLSNAMKYTNRGTVDFDIYYRNQVAEFRISDTGVGIAQKDIERIMAPFERVKSQGTQDTSGTGLGLTISRLLVDIMGGELKVESSAGSGSCFTISLMLSSVYTPRENDEAARRISSYQGTTKTVAVVDDDPNHRHIMESLLQPLGFKTLTTDSATKCLKDIYPKSPDIYLLDVSMPGTSGLELAQMLRENSVSVPIIMISADAEEHHHTHASQVAHTDYFVKPINHEHLILRIGERLNLQWVYKEASPSETKALGNEEDAPDNYHIPDHDLTRELLAYAQIGYKKGVVEAIDEARRHEIFDESTALYLAGLAGNMRFEFMSNLLEEKLA